LAQLPSIAPAVVPALSIARGFRPRDDFGSPVGTLSAAGGGEAGGAGFLGMSAVSAAPYNSMATMNHMRFECGVDLKALLKTSRKRLVRALWASPDSPEALAIGYATYSGAH
jgi:hypothetical protein